MRKKILKIAKISGLAPVLFVSLTILQVQAQDSMEIPKDLNDGETRELLSLGSHWRNEEKRLEYLIPGKYKIALQQIQGYDRNFFPNLERMQNQFFDRFEIDSLPLVPAQFLTTKIVSTYDEIEAKSYNEKSDFNFSDQNMDVIKEEFNQRLKKN